MTMNNKYPLAMLLVFVSTVSFGQWKSFTISPRGDTLNRVDQKDRKQGPWVNQVPELRGEQGYDEQGYYIDDKKDGLWKRFAVSGDKIAEETFRWGALDGKARYYNRTGALIRLESWRAVDPAKTMDTVDVLDIKDPSKVIDRVVVKLEGQTMKHGQWIYYDPEWGNVEKVENYFMDKLRTDDEVAATGGGDDDELKPIDVTKKKEEAEKKKPQAILDYEKKNSGKKKVRVRDGSTGN
ncbi:MAG: hypothetical protein EOO05_07590 [Chitinophagaceae bacterium]|nr:MAG: hypothetical protein EOO05_07590 [Chitinophagaceae bacterium]